MLNIDLIRQIVSYIESLGLKRTIRYAMTTNATLLNHYIDYLVEKDFTLLVSLDGDKDSNAYRITKDGCPSFDRVFENLQYCKNRYPAFFENNISFNSVLQDKSSIDQIVYFFKENFGKIPRIGELNPFHVDSNHLLKYKGMFRSKMDCLSHSSHRDAIAEELFMEDSCISHVFNTLRYNSGNFFLYYRELFIDSSLIQRTTTGTCTPFMLRMFVTARGKILPCEKISHDFFYGKVDKERVNLNVDDVAIQYNQYVQTIEKQCTTCEGRNNCPQCIYELRNKNGNFCCTEMISRKDIEQNLYSCYTYLQKHPHLYQQLVENVSFM